MAQHTPKVDPMSKLVGFASALVLLVVVFYFISSLMNTVDKNSLEGQVVEKPESKEEETKTASADEKSGGDEKSSGGSGGDIAAGKEKYASCAACHGADGKGQGGAFPVLTGIPANEAEKKLAAYRDGDQEYLKSVGLGDRYGTMAPNASNLSDEQIANLSVYIADAFGGTNGGGSAGGEQAKADEGASEKAEPAEPVIVSESMINHGQALFSNCAICHGENGAGGELFNAPKLAGMGMDQAASLLKIYRKGQEMGPNSYAMIPQATHLSDYDIDSLAAYIATLEEVSE